VARPLTAWGDFFGFFGALKRGDFFGVHPKKVVSAPESGLRKVAPLLALHPLMVICRAQQKQTFLGSTQKKSPPPHRWRK
jgi:hypothetical protein